MDTILHRECGIEWAVLSRPLPGESLSGDQFVVAPTADGVLLAVIDGLGHGAEATIAARRAVDVLTTRSGEPLTVLVQACHAALRDTRGAAMTLVALSHRDRTATSLGVGNVEAVIARRGGDTGVRRESVLLRNGVVGYQLPALQSSVAAMMPGDVLVFATDGIRQDFGDRITGTQPVAVLVEDILARHFRGTDDALVLACRIVPPHEA